MKEKFKGDSITLSGYIKTDGVTDGYAGLWIRVDPNVGFSNMDNKGVKGTTNWTKYSITVPLNSGKYEGINFGGMLFGKGRMWVDDLTITIDGKDISTLTPINNLPADKDYEFDKGSLIKIDSLDQNEITTLYQLGIIWGFLKYYHPSVIRGEYNWDYELFRILPKLLKVKKQSRDEILYNWISGLGKFEEKKENSEITKDSIVLKSDLAWITQSGFSPKLASLLQNIEKAQRPCNQQYYVYKTGTGNVNFLNERTYSYLPYPDDGFRLLSLFRYWNMVQYFFPYRDLIGKDWKLELKKFIPKYINAKNALQYKLTAFELAASIHDTHAFFDFDADINQFLGNSYLPVKFKFIKNKPVVAGYLSEELAKSNNLKVGDIITKWNNIPIANRIDTLSRYVPASNNGTLLSDIASVFARTNEPEINIELIRNGKKINTISLSYPTDKLNFGGKFSFSPPPTYKWISDSIGYVDHGKLKERDLSAMFEQFKNAKGLIIDLRNYPSDNLFGSLPNYLLSKPKEYAKTLVPDICHPGSFYFEQPIKTGKHNDKNFKGKLILLIDETSQSSSEFHAMAYRTYANCIVVGNNSAGADGNVSDITLPGNLKTRFSGIGIYYPDGTPTQRIGIRPDIIVKPTISDVIAQRDVVLEKAIQLLSK
ncbi:S41 family peptidase [Niabella aquatica]